MRWFGRRKELRSYEATPEFESLESRLAMYQGPMISGMPPLAALENQFDTVVRIDTNLGKIDIELFDYAFENIVNNFKDYVNSGRLDESFFHALGTGVLMGGRYKFDDVTGLAVIPTNAPVTGGFTRPNLERTLAMVPDTPGSTTNRFIINLQNNPLLDTLNGGYAVFGKVVQGWDVVQTIAGLTTRDLDQYLIGNNPNPGPFDIVPTTNDYNPSVGPTEATLVRIIDIEVVKSRGTNRYYTETLVFPEGFRTANTIERIDMMNLDSRPNFYQVIVRYETGDRDSVILSGVMQPNARISLKINDANFPGYNIVRSGVGYAFEIRTTLAFTASLNHRDNGVTIGETFQLLSRIFPGQLQTWTFAGIEVGPNITSYVLFQNVTDQKGQVNALITSQTGQTLLVPVVLEAARRGGIAIHTLGLPAGVYSVRLTTLIPIVASMSQYRTATGVSEGAAALGSIWGGRTEGYLAGAFIPNTGTAVLDFYYSDPNLGAIFVDTEFTLSNGTVINGNPVLLTAATRRSRVSIASLAPTLPTNQFFTVRFISRNGVTPVTASYSVTMNGDTMTTPFQTVTSRTVAFGDGFTDPNQVGTGMEEIISVFNPYATNVNFMYDVVFHFSDGTKLFASNGVPFSLGARARADHRASDFAHVMTKINSNPIHRFYSVEVVTTQFSLPTPVGGVVAQMTRIHTSWGQNYTAIPALDPRLQLLFLDNAEFD